LALYYYTREKRRQIQKKGRRRRRRKNDIFEETPNILAFSQCKQTEKRERKVPLLELCENECVRRPLLSALYKVDNQCLEMFESSSISRTSIGDVDISTAIYYSLCSIERGNPVIDEFGRGSSIFSLVRIIHPRRRPVD